MTVQKEDEVLEQRGLNGSNLERAFTFVDSGYTDSRV